VSIARLYGGLIYLNIAPFLLNFSGAVGMRRPVFFASIFPVEAGDWVCGAVNRTKKLTNLGMK